MYRRGHQGLVLLALAPIEYLLLRHGQPFLALLTLLGVVVVEPLPDIDQRVPWLHHRGTSHSFFSAVLVGLVLAGVGWIAGQHVLGGLAGVAADLSRLTAQPLQMSVFSDGPAWLLGGFARLSGTLNWIATQLGGFNHRTLALIGFAIGVGGIVIHLLGDVITISGIQPLLPVSNWYISVSRLRADSTGANFGLFALGVVVFVLVVSVAVPGVGLGASVPGVLSPVGAVQAQNTPHEHSPNGSVQINGTASQAQNAPAIEFTNQSTNDSTVVINRVSFPEGGFVVVHNALFLPPENQTVHSAVGLSRYLSPGVHHNVSVRLLSGTVNQSTGSQLLVATLSQDTNGNQTYDYVRSGGRIDGPYRNQSNETVFDQATVQPGPANGSSVTNASASTTLRFRNQVVNRSQPQVTVRSVTLPHGGFVAIHGSAYLDGVAPDLVTVSKYLPPGKYTNVTIPVSRGVPGAVQNQSTLGNRDRLAAVAYNDTNGNHHYDHYAATNSSIDAPYVNASGRPVLASGIVVTRSAGTGSSAPQISFENQTTNGSTVTVSSVTLRQPGFVAVSNTSTSTSLPPPAKRVIGVSHRLDAGTHHNVTIQLFDLPGRTNHHQRLRTSQSLIVTPTVDTGKTGTYQYVTSGGATDVPVVSPNGSVIASQAVVSVQNATQSSSTQTPTGHGQTGTTGATATAASAGGQRMHTGGGGFPWFWPGIGLIVVVIAGVALVWRWRR